MSTTAVELGTVLDFFNGKAPPNDEDGDFVVYGSNGTIGKAKTTNHENAIILGRVGAYCGSVEFCDEKFWASDNTIVVKTRDGFDLKYMYYRLKSFPLRSYAGGAAQPLLTQTILRGVRLPVVKDKNRQLKIAAILSAYDDLIENNRRRIQLLEQAARLLYKEWFVHLRFPGHEHTRTIDGVPEGWERQSLGEFATILKGKNITKETIEEGDVPVVAGGLKPAYYHNAANASGPVITVSASGANAGHVALYHQDVWASDCSYLSSSDNSEIWFLYLSMKYCQAEITGMQQGAAQPHVYPKHLKRLGLLLPSRNLRDLFKETVEVCFLQIANLEKQTEKLAKARDLLLPKLMNGEMVV